MKKIIALAVTVTALLSLASCGDSANDGNTSDKASSTVSAHESASSETVSVESAVSVPVITDIAIEATAFCDDNDNHFDQYEYAASCINDGDINTAWQKDGNINAGDGGTWVKDDLYGDDTDIFVGLEWTEEHYIGTVVIYNDAGNAMESYENGGYKLEYFDGENYIEVENLSDSRVTAGLMEITLKFDAVSTAKLRLTVYEGISGGKHSPKIYTMCVYEAEKPAEASSESTSE